jgi:hypothetical protein
MVTKDLTSNLLDERRFVKLDLDHNALRNLTSPDGLIFWAACVTTIVDLYGQTRGKRLDGVKTPGCVRKIPTLHYRRPLLYRLIV